MGRYLRPPILTQDTPSESWGCPGTMGRGSSGRQLSGLWRRTGFAERDSGQSEHQSHKDQQPAAQPEFRLLPQRGPGQLLQPGESPLVLLHLPIHLASLSSTSRTATSLPTPTQPDLSGRPRWQADDETPPEPRPLSLPVSPPSLHTPQLLDAGSSSEHPISQLPPEASGEIASPSGPSTASADPSSKGDSVSSLTEPQSLTLHLSPPHKASEDPIAQENPSSQLSTQPHPPESPQRPVPTKPNSDTTWTSQPLDSSSDPGSPENPRAQPSEVLQVEHTHLQPPKELGGPGRPASTWQEPATRSRPRVSELKKCFEA